jgi:hypothetical protein
VKRASKGNPKDSAAEIALLPQPGQRSLIIGMTGGGKTGFLCWVLKRLEASPIVIYDIKDEQKFPLLPFSTVVTYPHEILEAIAKAEHDYIIVRPPDHILGEPEELDEYLWNHYQNLRGVTAVIDEAPAFHRNGRAFKGLTALLARGRSRGITTIMAAQRPAMISRACITESQNLYCFYVGDGADKKRLTDIIPNFEDLPDPPEFGFYFFKAGKREVHKFGPIKLDPEMDTGYVDKTIDVEPVAETVPVKRVKTFNWV